MTTDTKPITAAELAAMKARTDAATAGPWEVRRNAGNHWGMREVFGPLLRILGFTVATDVTAEMAGQIESDCDFIASARSDMPRLIAEVERLQAERDGLQRMHDQVCHELLLSQTRSTGDLSSMTFGH